MDEETLHATGGMHLNPPPRPRKPPSSASEAVLDRYRAELDEYEARLVVWERVRDLVQKAALEPYAKEIVYAAPLIGGLIPKRGGLVEPVLAPLFTQGVTASVQNDGSIVITAQEESLRFNTALWQDATSTEGVGQIQELGINAQGDLAAGYRPDRVAELLDGVAAVLPFAHPGSPEGIIEPWPERPAPVSVRRNAPELHLVEGAALFLSNRSSQYLLHDLEEIQADPSQFLRASDRPLNVLLSPPSAEPQPELEWLTVDRVNFPFPSNPAQRQVADALAKNTITVVQGPPGTGKSLTIANLVAHLVAEGKSVLVTSHKHQALTVVRDKLDETGLQFLYASLIGDTGPAKRELQAQIANVGAFAGAANAERLRRQLYEIEERRVENGARYAATRGEFIARAEPEQVEAAGLHPAFENHSLLPLEDPAVPEEDRTAVIRGLRDLDRMAREHAGVWADLVTSKLGSSTQIAAIAVSLRHFLDHQHARVRAATDQRIRKLVEEWHPVFDADPKQIAATRGALEAIESSLVEPFSAITERGDTGELASAKQLRATPKLLQDCREGLAELENQFDSARQLAHARNSVSADPVRRAEVIRYHADSDHLLPRRRARKWLSQHAPGAAGLEPEIIKSWADFWSAWSELQTRASGLAGGLGSEIPDVYSPDAVAQLIARVTRVVNLAEALTDAERAVATVRATIPLSEAYDCSSPADLRETINRWSTALSAAEADREGNRLIASDELALLRKDLTAVDHLLDSGQVAEVQAPLARLERVWSALPDLEARRHLLLGPTGQLTHAVAAIEDAGSSDAKPPEFMADLDAAVAVHKHARRFAEIAESKTTRDLALELRQLHEQVLEDARRLLGLRIQKRILEGYRSPKFLASLESFRKAVSTSAKRHERFEELKNSPYFDIEILTKVFPCWIMRPEDACRIFPLKSGIFDVVIFDEASQCNPDQALPLFARGKKVVVFGDDKQLSNEDLRRSLSSAANKALLRQANLPPLDPEGLFDQTRNSLLGLVGRRAQAAVLLNEHFRCRPEIAAFSNERFYGSALTIIRDRADDRGLGPALIVRQVLNAGLVGPSKVNYVEARAVVDELKKRLGDPRYEGMTLGVLSLFREQIEHIQTVVEREIDRKLLEKHRIICSTVDGFQGDERDVILYSWRFGPGSSPSIFAFTGGEGGSQRVNVALTRAKHQAIHFISAPLDKFPVGASNVTPFLRHCLEPARLLQNMEQRAHRTPGGEARRRVALELTEAGFEIREDFVACGVSIDLLAAQPEGGGRAAVFVDAEVDPHPPPAALHRVDAHSLLERAGWSVVRVPATDALPNPGCAIGLVSASISSHETLERPSVADPHYATVSVPREGMWEFLDDLGLSEEIAPEDRADYHWEVGSVEARLHGGEAVFMSDFERELYDALAAHDGLNVVPQWPSRGKFIDLVVTDQEGRRLAVEADGDQHHDTIEGELIPEDVERQGLLEEAGWVFHRIKHSAYRRDPEGEIARVLTRLREQQRNPALAARMRAEALLAVGASGADELVVTESLGSTDGDNGEADADTRVKPQDSPPAPEAVPVRDSADTHLSPADLDDLIEEVLEGIELPRGSHHSDDDKSADGLAVRRGATSEIAAAPGVASRHFDDLPLGEISMMIANLVAQAGAIAEDELASVFQATLAVEVPESRHQLLRRFAWSAKGRRWLRRIESSRTWLPGSSEPEPVAQLREWTYAKVLRRAEELTADGSLDENQQFERLLGEVYAGPEGGRVPRLIMSIVGKALYIARQA